MACWTGTGSSSTTAAASGSATITYAPGRGDVSQLSPIAPESGWVESDDEGATATGYFDETYARTGYTDSPSGIWHRGLLAFDTTAVGAHPITRAQLTLPDISGVGAATSCAWDLHLIGYSTGDPVGAWGCAPNETILHTVHISPRPGAYYWDLGAAEIAVLPTEGGTRAKFRLVDASVSITDTDYWLPPISEATLRLTYGVVNGAGSSITTAVAAGAGTVTHATWTGAGASVTVSSASGAGTVESTNTKTGAGSSVTICVVHGRLWRVARRIKLVGRGPSPSVSITSARASGAVFESHLTSASAFTSNLVSGIVPEE
jgi:hypothetical protein